MSKKKEERVLLFDRAKYTLLIAGLLVTALGFVLMIGGGSADSNEFSYDLFSFRRITLAPFLVLAGFGIQIYAIMKKTSNEAETKATHAPKKPAATAEAKPKK
ncbi:MAG: DUF3098 domain-containing protein [Bacteroidales bacterium]|nr:DUF3098 domain-containing protein [Bacteroidales bacterium]